MTSTPLPKSEADERAKRIHAEHIVADSLLPDFIAEWVMTPEMIEMGKQMQSRGLKRLAIGEGLAEHLIKECETNPITRQAYMAYWRRSGVTVGSNTLYFAGPPDSAWESLITRLGRANRMLAALQGELVQANTADDIVAAHRAQRHAVMFNAQNAEPVGDRLDRVDTLHGLGLRCMQLTYNLRSRFGDGCLENDDGGISRFGQALVEKMNSVRMMVDVSHAGPRTAAGAVAASARPPIASHTVARALSGHARGLPDEVLKAIADRGGYAGVVLLPAFLHPPGGDPRPIAAGKPPGWATLDMFVDHVRHLVNVMGVDHVGVGTDWGKPYYSELNWTAEMVQEPSSTGFDWVAWRPQDNFDCNNQMLEVETWDKWPNVTAALLQGGFSESDVIKIVGGNFLRVFRDICG